LQVYCSACFLLHASFFHGLFFDLENRGDAFLLSVSCLSTVYTALCLRR
jgi:hypothetical protein